MYCVQMCVLIKDEPSYTHLDLSVLRKTKYFFSRAGMKKFRGK